MKGIVKQIPVDPELIACNIPLIWDDGIITVGSFDGCNVFVIGNDSGYDGLRLEDLNTLILEYNNPDCEQEGGCIACDSSSNNRREKCIITLPIHPLHWKKALSFLNKEVEFQQSCNRIDIRMGCYECGYPNSEAAINTNFLIPHIKYAKLF